MRISDWSSDVCSSDLEIAAIAPESISGERVSERTYIDFDVAVVVGESDTTAKAGDGRIGADIQVATIVKASAGMGGKAEATSTASQQQTHRVAFKVPVYLNAHFRENETAMAAHKTVLAEHGLDAAPASARTRAVEGTRGS